MRMLTNSKQLSINYLFSFSLCVERNCMQNVRNYSSKKEKKGKKIKKQSHTHVNYNNWRSQAKQIEEVKIKLQFFSSLLLFDVFEIGERHCILYCIKNSLNRDQTACNFYYVRFLFLMLEIFFISVTQLFIFLYI